MEESFVQVYQNQRQIPSGIQTLNIPIMDRMLINEPSMFAPEGTALQNLPIRHLELQKYSCTFHMSYDLLEDSLNINLNRSDDFERNLQHIAVFLGDIATSTHVALETIQPLTDGHPVIIDRVDLGHQYEYQQIIINIKFWAVASVDADIGRAAFERILHQSLANGSTRGLGDRARNSPLPYLDPSTFPRESYDINAEENAHELLKGMLTKKQFELYKNEGYVVIKGTYGRTYKVNKNDMMDVEVKRKGSKKNTYRLCIEPRDTGTICPTDEVIAKIKLIQSSEKELHKVGIKWHSSGSWSTGEYRGCVIIESNRPDDNVTMEISYER